ncbi:hypothetical protein pEaSNUABM37_00317 [Erwinia phage pEa_SNUABM_37]|nr:hypothetical protein pEaSNUABM37_00317 [Erwinia phage pEa_SNUABM_37]QXO10785.1 hypothetical protein pEaSNUABM48_00317 [Erwinia phage pEa_SNUABM_48]
MRVVTVVKFKKDVIHPYLSQPEHDTIRYTPDIEKLGTVLNVFQEDKGIFAWKLLSSLWDDEGQDYYRVVDAGEMDDLIQGLLNGSSTSRGSIMTDDFTKIAVDVDFKTERLGWRLEEV